MHGKSRARGYLKLQTISSMFHEHRLNNIVRDNVARASLWVSLDQDYAGALFELSSQSSARAWAAAPSRNEHGTEKACTSDHPREQKLSSALYKTGSYSLVSLISYLCFTLYISDH